MYTRTRQDMYRLDYNPPSYLQLVIFVDIEVNVKLALGVAETARLIECMSHRLNHDVFTNFCSARNSWDGCKINHIVLSTMYTLRTYFPLLLFGFGQNVHSAHKDVALIFINYYIIVLNMIDMVVLCEILSSNSYTSQQSIPGINGETSMIEIFCILT